MYPEQLTQALSVADVINTQSLNNAAVNSTGIDLSKFRRALYVVETGVLGAVTVNGLLQSCSLANFASGVHNVSNGSLTTLNTNNSLATLEVRADQVESGNAGDRYVRLQLSTAGGAATVGAVGLGSEAAHKPGNAADLNTTQGLSQRIVVSP